MKNDLNLKEYAEIPDLETYVNKPVQNFGLSLLKNMGFDEKKGIGKRHQNALSEPVILKSRPRGQGLGAEVEQKKQQFQIGDFVLIMEQPHDGLIGIITEIKEKQMTVQLKKSGSLIKLSRDKLKKLNQNQIKQIEEQKIKENEDQKKKKRLKWIVPNIKLKIINKQSEYYLKKVVVSELLSDREFECIFRNEKGNMFHIRNLREKDVQTVVPKVGETVLIVQGKHTGQKGKVFEKDKQKSNVIVQTFSELEMLKLSQDEICQYIQF